MKPSTFFESALLFIAIALMIPVPTSNGEHYPAFPLLHLSVLVFLGSRIMRHVQSVPAEVSRVPEILVAIAETVIFAALVFVMRQAVFLA